MLGYWIFTSGVGFKSKQISSTQQTKKNIRWNTNSKQALIAQLVEHAAVNRKVLGSNPG